MWSPTHVQLTVQRARGLLTKGKNGTNDCFVTIVLGKDKFQTSVRDKAGPEVEWHEECELSIPTQGNTAEIVLTVYHQNLLDEFLGQVHIPLAEQDIYERPKNRWFKLQSKDGKKKEKERGDLEVRIAFTVKAGSLTDLSKKEKHKSSLGKLAHSVGGSLLSIGTLEKRKGLKKVAKSLGSKLHLNKKDKDKKKNDSDQSLDSAGIVGSTNELNQAIGIKSNSKQRIGDADPGVISEDEDEFAFDDLSHKSSASSLNLHGEKNLPSAVTPPVVSTSILPSTNNDTSQLSMTTENAIHITQPSPSPTAKTSGPKKPPRSGTEPADEWEQKLYGRPSELFVGSNDSLKRRSWAQNPFLTDERGSKDSVADVNASPEKVPDITVSLARDEFIAISAETTPKPLPKPRAPPVEHHEKEKEGIFSKKLKYFKKDKHIEEPKGERIIIGGENESSKAKKLSNVPHEILQKYEGKTREEIIGVAHSLQGEVAIYRAKCRELEDYLDSLLLRVMETTPKILQNPYNGTTQAMRMGKHSHSG